MARFPVNTREANQLAKTPLGEARVYATQQGLVVSLTAPGAGDEDMARLRTHVEGFGLQVTDVLVMGDQVTIEASDPANAIPLVFIGRVERISPFGEGMAVRIMGESIVVEMTKESVLTRDGDVVRIECARRRGMLMDDVFHNITLEN